MSRRVDELVARLNKGAVKTTEFFARLTDEQWGRAIYSSPTLWTARDVLAHFVSSEQGLLSIAQDVASGGPGAPEGFDYDAFNAAEQNRLAALAPHVLLASLTACRQATVDWMSGLTEADLDRIGRHPALGCITLEAMINAMYGHQLMHVRDLARELA